MAENPVPKSPVFICDDITAEALGSLMADNKERMGIFSTEGEILESWLVGTMTKAAISTFTLKGTVEIRGVRTG